MVFDRKQQLLIDECTHAVIEGQLDEAQLEELEKVLSSSEEARESFVKAMAFEAMLMCEFPVVHSLPSLASIPAVAPVVQSPSPIRMFAASIMVAAITLFAFLLFKFADFVDYHIIYWRSDKLMQKKSTKRKAAFLKALA